MLRFFSKQGFTLIELMVAMISSSIIIIAVSHLCLETLRFQDRLQSNLFIFRESRVLMSIIGDGTAYKIYIPGIRGSIAITNQWQLDNGVFVLINNLQQNIFQFQSLDGNTLYYNSYIMPLTQKGMVNNAVIGYNSAPVINLDGNAGSLSATLTLSEPDIRTRLGVSPINKDLAYEEFWWFFNLNKGTRVKKL